MTESLVRTTHPTGELTGVRAVLHDGTLRSVFQPIVRLVDHRTVGFEALMRGPAGSSLESPVSLLTAARSERVLGELDWCSRVTASRTARRAQLDPAVHWFLNVEPETLAQPCPASLRPELGAADSALEVVLEFTERDLVGDPARLLTAVAQARRSGQGIALDDVGADPASLALLPFVQPDVIKLDMRLVRRHMDREVAAISNAVRAHAESTGAVILAEGIEDDEDLLVARTLGAELGQGWLFGRPGRLPSAVSTPPAVVPHLQCDTAGSGQTPFEIVAAVRPSTVSSKRLLRPISRHLEDQAASGATPGVIMACFQHAQFFTERMARRYGELAGHTAFTAALAVDLPSQPAPGVRGTSLHPTEPLVKEWNVLVVGAHYAGALVARDLGDDGDDDHRRFAYAVTHDRALVIAAARALLGWVAPA